MAISGLGGIGKTQVALQFVYFVKENYPEFSIFWLQAMGMESFKEGYMGIAQAIGIHQKLENEEDLMVLVQQRLSSKSAGKWLLIADNVDDLDLLRGQDQMKGLLNLLPESDDGLILFTTRHGAIAQHLAGSDIIDLGNMTERETIDLLERSLIRKGDSHGNKDTMDLLVELEFLPLAVKQVAAYVNTNRSSISEYLSLLRNTPEEAIAIVSTDFSDKMRYPNLASGVAKTWTITFNRVLQLDPIAADLLKFMSCIAWRAIPHSILPSTYSDVQLARAIGLLCSFSLIERRNHGTKLDMHRLVHLATRLWVAKSGQQGETTMAAFKQLSEVFPSHYYTDRETWREYMPHVAYLERYNLHHDSAERAELCMRVGKCLLVDERVKEATVWLRQSCEWREKNLSPHHTQRLTSQRYLAMAYRQSGQLKESMELLEYVVAMAVAVLAEDDPDRLVSQYQLAVSYQANGQTEESIKLLENIVCIQTHLLPHNDDRRLGSQHMLAMAYQTNGRVQASIELLEHITSAEAEKLAEDDPKRLSSQHTLAMAYSENSQIEEAIKLLTHVCTIKAKSFAESHPNRLVSEYALAMAYKDNSQIAESIKLLRHITTTEATFLAEDDPYRLMSVNELASCYELLPKESGTDQPTASFVGKFPADQGGQPVLSRESWGSEVTWNAFTTSATGFDQVPEHQELGLRSTSRSLLSRPRESVLGKRKK
ncbi:TPR repeat protein [Penicillium cosmopolitanum]|uniref:TPR repeat protein n=1 Tax=Penicillium cosmopolitanum TaxID=1131564 RepID=A0A9X0BEI5_9EURO|nr:TPR repeat protein [Penicillium cosmopolitanum]KAJ5414170.1 TPR repeat protein [Penicillium cosmopolitanum]